MRRRKVVLLGRYNAQGLGAAEEEVARTAVVTDRGLVGTASTDAPGGDRVVVPPACAAAGETGGGGASAAGGSRGRLGNGVEFLTRVTPGTREGSEYVKVVVVSGRVQGAMLVGDTELEEAMEHLILDQTDISAYGEHLLDDGLVDLADFFD